MKIKKAKKLGVRLFVDTDNLRSLLGKKYGFRITNASLDVLPNGFLRAMVEWTSDNKDVTHLFKYVREDGQLLSDDEVVQHLEFVYLSKRFKGRLEIGLESTDGKSVWGRYNPLCIQNLKYGVLVYFAPKNWENGAKTVEHYEWNEEKKDYEQIV